MLSKIEAMRTAETRNESQITALLGIANEMAVIVNACTVQPYPEGLIRSDRSIPRWIFWKSCSDADGRTRQSARATDRERSTFSCASTRTIAPSSSSTTTCSCTHNPSA